MYLAYILCSLDGPRRSSAQSHVAKTLLIRNGTYFFIFAPVHDFHFVITPMDAVGTGWGSVYWSPQASFFYAHIVVTLRAVL